MKMIESEENLFVNGKCIGTVKDVLERLLNARQEFEKYQNKTLEYLYFPVTLSAIHENSYNQDMPLDFVDTPSVGLSDKNLCN